jgi:hypothetical protein
MAGSMTIALAASNVEAGDTTCELLASHLRIHGAEYLPGSAGDVRVRLAREEHRPVSSLYEFELSTAESAISLLIKVPVGTGGVSPVRPPYPRPTLAADAVMSYGLEHSALAAIHQHFERLDDPRFGAIRVFDMVPRCGALIMERLRQPSLRSLFMRSGRWRGGNADDRMEAAFANAGSWLRSYHGIDREISGTRHSRRSDFVGIVDEIAAYVGKHLGESGHFRRVADTIRERAERGLPEVLPLGLGHGDFALRNILVGDSGEVTVCDTRARWRTSIYEDLGYFLVGLKRSWPQLYSLGLAFDARALARYENRFLEGYFASEELPLEAVRLYEMLALLDRLGGVVSLRASSASWTGRLRRTGEIALLSRELRRALAAGKDSSAR